MAIYTYKGEEFTLDKSGDCLIKVTDPKSGHAATVHATKGEYFVSRVRTFSTGGTMCNTLNVAIEMACVDLLSSRRYLTQKEANQEMDDFLERFSE